MSLKFKIIFTLVLILLQINIVCAVSHHPQELLDKIKDKKGEGEQLVNHFCANCHDTKPLIQIGAPRINNYKDWYPRLKQDINLIVLHTNEGYKAMPARGGCFECSDKQLILATLSMLPEKLRQKFLDKLKDK